MIDSIDSMPEKYRPKLTNEWTIGVIPGPQPTPEYLKPEYLKTLTESEYEVNFNSARTGIRLMVRSLSGYGRMAARQDFIRQTFTTMPMR